MSTEFDFTNEKPWEGGGILTEGTYEIRVDDIEIDRSTGGHPQVTLSLNDTGGAGQITDWLVLTPNNLGKWLQVTQAFAIENPGKIKLEDDKGKPTPEWVAHVTQLAGKTAWIRVAPEQNNVTGEFRDRVQFFSRTPLANPSNYQSEVPADMEGLQPGGSGDLAEEAKGLPF